MIKYIDNLHTFNIEGGGMENIVFVLLFIVVGLVIAVAKLMYVFGHESEIKDVCKSLDGTKIYIGSRFDNVYEHIKSRDDELYEKIEDVKDHVSYVDVWQNKIEKYFNLEKVYRGEINALKNTNEVLFRYLDNHKQYTKQRLFDLEKDFNHSIGSLINSLSKKKSKKSC